MNSSYVLLLVFSSVLLAQPITGEAESLVFEKNRLVYEGNVRLVRGSSVLRAKRVTVIVGENGRPVKLIAEGEVVYREPGRTAVANYAEYDLKEEVIVLRGRARVEEGGNLIEAEEIVYDRRNKMLRALGRGRKVRTIYIEEEGDEEVGPEQGDREKKGDNSEEGSHNRRSGLLYNGGSSHEGGEDRDKGFRDVQGEEETLQIR